MDCGPAALKCLLEGFGIQATYGRLREACQTGVDGTSIDTMETVANQLGLKAEQLMLPIDHLLLPEAKGLPALVVVTLPNGLTHFVVVWSRVGRLLQVMDPSVGRRWVSVNRFAREIYVHRMAAAAADWLEFARSGDFQLALRARLRRLGAAAAAQNRLLTGALAEGDWRAVAAMDAAVRLVASLVEDRAVSRGRDALRLVERLSGKPGMIPERYWSVRPGPLDTDGGEQLLMSGAVLVRVSGRQTAATAGELGRELAAAVQQKPASAGRELASALWRSAPFSTGLLLSALLVAAAGTVTEAMLFRGLFDVSHELGLVGQRLGAMSGVLLFGLALLVVEVASFAIGGRLGRHIENRLRVRFLEKIPKLGDRYFQSRLISDMAERSHAAKRLRNLPDQARRVLSAGCALCFTAAAITWLEPSAAIFVWLIVAVVLIPLFAAQPTLAERDLRVRSHAAGLTRFYLDSMLGLSAVRAHGGERNIRNEHGKLLREWARAALGLQRVAVSLEGVQFTAIFALIGALLLTRSFSDAGVGRVLLLIYWALNLGVLGQEIGGLMRQYPYYRNLTLRLLDPLGAPEEETAFPEWAGALSKPPSLQFRSVSVQVSGHTILDAIDLEIDAGSHVAIVGPSGAGKSSLVGLLLGWLTPTAGEIRVNQERLDTGQVRSSAAWVDPAVQLWNRSMLSNITYGAASESGVGEAIDRAMLRSVLESLADGMQTRLGEGGALVSGGEGQRVRFARALLRSEAKLVILDEPFRGLDRDKRRELLARARTFWREATLLCITHDLSETEDFDRVVVIEHGRVAETGRPEHLSSLRSSRYAQLLDAEQETRSGLWGGEMWRHVHVQSGQVTESRSRPSEVKPLSEVA